MTRCNLTGSQMDEVLAVLNNERQSDFKTGSIRVQGLSKPAMAFLKSKGFIAKDPNGKYYPKDSRSTLGPYFSVDWMWLPVDILWRVVAPMLNDGHSGYSITANRGWNRLNLYSKGEYGYSEPNEEQVMRVLLELSAYGYIWFQFGGSIWCIDKRDDVNCQAVA